MFIKDFASEYELDWMASSIDIKNLNNLKDKKILILSNNAVLDNSLIYSILYANDKKNLKMQITLLTEISQLNFEDGFDYRERKDVKIVDIDAAENLDTMYDYTFFSGCCCKYKENFLSLYLDSLNFLNKCIVILNEIKIYQFVLLSDYRVYCAREEGQGKYLYSEYELGSNSKDKEGYTVAQFMRSIETVCISFCKSKSINYNILRAGIIIGAGIRIEHCVFNDLIYSFAAETPIEICKSKDLNSFVYISDVLSAVFSTFVLLPKMKVFNVCGDGCSVSTNTFVNVLEEVVTNKKSIEFNAAGRKAMGIAMNNSLIKNYGWVSKMNLEDAVEIVVKSILGEEKVFIFNGMYQGKLDRIHKILLGLLLEMDRICKKHDIKYFLAGGTLLGAVRHNGFIPWDDDVDIMMLREDYDKFAEIAPKEMNKNMFYQIPKTETLNHCVFTKIRLDNSVFATNFTSKFMEMHNGLFLDILAHDQTANIPWMQKIHIFATRLIRSLVFNKWGNTDIKGNHKYLIKALNIIKNTIPIGILEKGTYFLLTMYSNKKNSEYLYDGMGRNINKGAFPKKWLEDTIMVDFEGYPFPIPKEYHNYLTYLYGDYMDMIPVSKRKASHDIPILDLGEYDEMGLFGRE